MSAEQFGSYQLEVLTSGRDMTDSEAWTLLEGMLEVLMSGENACSLVLLLNILTLI